MTELKQSRWVKIHEPGQANYAEHNNIMDIKIGGNRCQADVLYTVRSYKKAGYWLTKYLEAAEATAILAEAAERIMSAVESADREDPDVTVETDDWTCAIERMSSGAFKVSFMWQSDEPVVKKQIKKEDKTVQKPAAKKQFKNEDLISESMPPVGACFWIEGEQLERVRKFEEKNNALVYHVIHSYTNIGEMESYLYVSDYPEEWEMDRQDIGAGQQLCYVLNHDAPECSEFGSIGIELTPAAGLRRIW